MKWLKRQLLIYDPKLSWELYAIKCFQGGPSCQYGVGIHRSEAVFVSIIRGRCVDCGCNKRYINTWWRQSPKCLILTAQWHNWSPKKTLSQACFESVHLSIQPSSSWLSKSEIIRPLSRLSNTFTLEVIFLCFNKLIFLDINFLQLEISQYSSVNYVLQHADARLTFEYMYKNFIPQTNPSSARDVVNLSRTGIHIR